ncbi:MAG: hypothetical protein AAFY64_04190 [Pseudomonadota bacterium]
MSVVPGVGGFRELRRLGKAGTSSPEQAETKFALKALTGAFDPALLFEAVAFVCSAGAFPDANDA